MALTARSIDVLVELRRALPDIARIFMALTATDWLWLSTPKAAAHLSDAKSTLPQFELHD
ncbi:hypothetical protein [Rhizobium esperanzae]|uniref:hypothetical protein n=1 Tax=Rhizobium esperanzae TaxID=1967781 RepID=UPI00161EE469|nr:hypothetical protein [Rhizobium esperanzae]